MLNYLRLKSSSQIQKSYERTSALLVRVKTNLKYKEHVEKANMYIKFKLSRV